VDKVRKALFTSALDLGDPGLDTSYGYGLVHAFDALKNIPGSPASTPLPTTVDTTPLAITPVSTTSSDVHILASISISSPADSSTFVKGSAITFSGTATDSGGGDLSPSLQWSSNIDGPIGSGASFSYTKLTPGTHTITAQATDSNGTTGSSTISITVTPLSGPHGKFNGSTDGCALCHRAHSATAPGELLNFSSSSFVSNDFCLSCHDGTTASAVSTHSNIDSKMKIEPQFEILCVQCHDPHGSSNLSAVRSNVFSSLNPNTNTGPVTFTALSGSNSFDDGVSPAANRICVTCHTSAMTNNHAGGANHKGGSGNDYSGQSCISCHPHDADKIPSTKD
jgi:predicted CXXCH cytochrome family protein